MQPSDLKALAERAKAAADSAYAPYSKFHVGAALLAADGRIFCAPNIENASYGLGLCAETNAMMAAVTAGAKGFRALAVVGYRAEAPEEPVLATPCGRCRQILAEFCPPHLTVHIAPNSGGTPLTVTLADLLPHAFGPGALGNADT
ncbi:MAG: cytidine deaminase [Pseudomonadota bacterium]